ncbi:MAG: peptidoglycan-binding protein [Alphaproteobacteria bacterium]|nr:peptidoglycan-binding protein [Alphaproteobacteria bacterium]
MMFRRLAILFCAVSLTLAAAPAPDAGSGGADPNAAPADLAAGLDAAAVSRLQEALAALGLYAGPTTGVYDRATHDALIAFRRDAGVARAAPLDAAELQDIEKKAAAATLLGDLQRARAAEIDAARAALLSDPATRDLVEAGSEPADPTRDAAACLARPTVRCLLDEAVESAKAVADDERRDWAFSDILAVQARAGLEPELLATLRRIEDPRRILRALRTIAVEHARGGDRAGAFAAADRIPDPDVRAAALADIAQLDADAAAPLETPRLVGRGGESAPRDADSPPRFHAIDLIDLALVRLESGETEAARQLLEEGAATVASVDKDNRRAYPRFRLALAHITLAERTGAAEPLDAIMAALDAPHLRAHAYARLAALHAAQGRGDAAAAATAKADRALAAVPSRLRRIWTAADIAEALRPDDKAAGTRYLERARAEAAGYDSPWGRARALARLADAYLAFGEEEADR